MRYGMILALVLVLVCAAGISAAVHMTALKSGAFGCVNEDDSKQLVQYLQDQDKQAFLSQLDKLIIDGQATTFEANESVYVEDMSLLNSYAQVRRPGETTSYWVYYKFFP